MRLFVANRTGTGVHGDAFRPDVDVAAVGGRLGSFELTANRFLCVAPNAVAAVPLTVDLGDLVGQRLAGQRLTRMANALDLTTAELSDMTIGEALLLRLGSDLRPAQGRMRIRCAGVDLYDAPAIQGGATDSFTYSNGALSTVSGGLWAAVEVDCPVASNAVNLSAASTLYVSRHTGSAPGDQFSEFDYNLTDGETAAVTRCSSSTNSYFYTYVNSAGAAEMCRVTTGAFVVIDSVASGLANPGTWRSQCVGSLHTAYRNGVEVMSATDSAFASNNFVGIGGGITTACTIDNWSGGTISTATIEQEGFRVRNDDGSETTATWRAAQDTDTTVPLATNFRLRALLNATGDPASFPPTLYYKKSTDSVYVLAPVGSAATGSAPVIEGTAETAVTTAGTNHAITLPASIAATDLVLIVIDKGTPATTATFNALTDWTEDLDENVASGLAIMRYTGTGVPGNPTFVSSAAIRSASIAYRISGADKTIAPQIGTTATGTSATPNPPSVTPTGGTSKPYLFIAFFGSAGEEADDDTWVNTPPTNYLPSPPLQKACGTVGTNLGGLIGAASRTNTSGAAEDPGTFGIDVSAAWRAQTIIIHPIMATPPVYVATSANVTAGGEATTFQLSAPAGKTTGDFVVGRMWDDENGTDSIDITTDDYTEVEWVLQFQTPAVDTDAYDFRVYEAGAPADTYTLTPRITIASSNDVSVIGRLYLGSAQTAAASTTKNVTGHLPAGTATHATLSTSKDTTGRLFSGPTAIAASSTARDVTGRLNAAIVADIGAIANDVSVIGRLHLAAASHALVAPAKDAISRLYVAGGATVPTVATTRGILGRLFHAPAPYATDTTTRTATGSLFTATMPRGSPPTFPYPASVSSRKILDQNGNVFLLKTMASWAMGENCSNAEITSALEGLAAKGFNAVTAAWGGVDPLPGNPTWHNKYLNDAGQAFFTGTAFQSSLGAAWASMDHLVAEATRLEMTVLFVLHVSWGSTGTAPEIVAASTTQMYNFGASMATRYAAYRNIIWHVMCDVDFNYGDSRAAAIDAYCHGIVDTEGATHRLITTEPDYPRTAYSQFISQEGTSGTGYEWFHVSVNTHPREPCENQVEVFDVAWNETGATTEAVWTDEPIYVHAPHYSSGNELQQVRERNYGTFIRGGVGINYGNERWWTHGSEGFFEAVQPNWLTEVLAEVSTVEAGYCWAFVDEWCKNTAWTQTNSFITTGLGTGDVRAAQGSSGSAALAYFPDNRTIVVDTTILNGTGNVRLRWFDPVANSYSSIATSEAQQTGRSVTLPAARGDGTRDFILVADLLADVSTSGRVNIGVEPYATVTHEVSVSGRLFAGPVPISNTTHEVSLAGRLLASTTAYAPVSHDVTLASPLWLGSAQYNSALTHNANVAGPLNVGSFIVAPVTHDTAIANAPLFHGTAIYGVTASTTDTNTIGIMLLGVIPYAMITRTASIANAPLLIGTDQLATVSRTTPIMGVLPIGMEPYANVTHELTITLARLTTGQTLYALISAITDISTTGLMIIGDVARATVSHEVTPSGLLVVGDRLAAGTITHDVMISGVLPLGEHITALVGKSTSVAGRIDTGAGIIAATQKIAQLIGLLNVGVALWHTGFVPPVFIGPLVTVNLGPDRTTATVTDERTTEVIR